jgi:hypothetical protein
MNRVPHGIMRFVFGNYNMKIIFPEMAQASALAVEMVSNLFIEGLA